MGGTYNATMGDRGRLVVPAELREHAGLMPGTPLILMDTDDGIVVMTRDQLRERIRKELAGPSLVDELIAERRAEAKRDA